MTIQQKGWFELGGRVARALLSSPRFRARLQRALDGVDPAGAVELVRSLLWTDPEVPMSVLGTAPRLANAGILALGTAAAELSWVSRDMAAKVAADLWDEVQLDELEDTWELCLERFFDLSPSEAGFKLASGALALLLGALERELERDPDAGARLAALLDDHPRVKEVLTR